MVIFALAIAVVITYIVWIRRPQQRMIKRLRSEMRLSAAFAKPGEMLQLSVKVLNEKSMTVPLLRVDIDLPEELAFVGEETDLPRHRTHMCTLDGHDSITFTHTVTAQREGKVAIESPELIVYGITGAVIDNNSADRGQTAARLRIRYTDEA